MNQRIVSIRPNNQNAIKNALLRKKKIMDAGGAVGSLLNGVVGNNFSYGDPYPGNGQTIPLNQTQQNNQFQYPGYPGLNPDMPQPTGNGKKQKKGIKGLHGFDINNMPTNDNNNNNNNSNPFSAVGDAINQKTDARHPSNNLNKQNNAINSITKAVGSKDPVSSAIFGLGELGSGIIDSAEPNDTKGNIVGKTAGKDALTGMGVGSKIGGYFGPIGSLIGAGAGALVGGVAGIFQGDKERDELIAQQKRDQLAANQQSLNQYQAKVNANPSSVYGNRYGSYFAMGGNMKKLFDDGGSIGYDDQQYNMGMSPIEQIEQMFDDQSQFQPIQDDQQQYDEDGNPISQNQEGDDDEGTQYDEYGNPIDQSQEGDEDEGTDQDEDGDNGEDTEDQYALGGNIPQGFSKSEFYPSMAGRGKMPFQSNDLMPKGSTSFANGGRLIYEGADSLSSKVNSANRYPGPPPIGNGLIFKPIPRNFPIASQNGYPLSTEHNVINPKFAGGGNIPFVNNYPTIPRQIAPHINLAPVDNAIPGNYRGIDFRGDHKLNLPTYDDGGNVGGNEIATGLKDMLGGMGGGGGASGLISMIGGSSGGGGGGGAAGGIGAGMLANGGNLTPQWDYNPDAVNTAINPNMENYANGGGIHIKKANRGKFTASAHRAGMGVQTFAHHVLSNKDKYSPKLIKRANFARNFGGRKKHENGGYINNIYTKGSQHELDDNEINNLINQGYKIRYV